jgi:hypothetical protein
MCHDFTVSSAWHEEIDCAPDTAPVSMGTRSLGDRPWLIHDDNADEELSLKAHLCTERPDEVLAVDEANRAPAAAVSKLIAATGHPLVDLADLHPLDRAGRSVQEDLCLMHRRPTGWHFDAASVCFPSRWRLADKIGLHVAAVHGPVQGYERGLAERVNHLFDRLGEAPVWRRNWFVHPNPALFQPDRPTSGDPFVAADKALSGLYLRSERQTLRRLPGFDGWILFTIRIQQSSLGQFVEDPDRATSFARYLDAAPEAALTHRGMSPDQVAAVRQALT